MIRRDKIYGVLGYPAKHSLSPLMHNAAFSFLKINARYEIFEKKPQELGVFLRSLAPNNIFGLNVTAPYKETVISFLDRLSSEARLIGAVNTIRVCGSKLEGFNTDGEGFLRHLSQDLKFNPRGKIIAVLGAGGAAKAIAVYLGKVEPRRIAIYDTDRLKLSQLASHLKENFTGIEFIQANSIAQLKLSECDLLVNATPVGMKEADPCLVDAEFMRQGLLVYDLIYNPPETRLLKIARKNGSIVSNGLGMLLYQGVLAFELWTGKKAPVEIMRNALLEAIKQC